MYDYCIPMHVAMVNQMLLLMKDMQLTVDAEMSFFVFQI